MRAAYQQAGWSPLDAVDLIECHATGTPVGDAVEYRSLRTLWGEEDWQRGQCVIGSVKATVGHLLTAAGAAGLVKVLSALGSKTLPPTTNFATPAPGLDLERSPLRILNAPAAWPEREDGTPRRAALSAFGFGGINAHLLLEEFLPSRPITGPRSEKGACAAAVRLPERESRWPSPSSPWTPISVPGPRWRRCGNGCWAAGRR